LDPLRLEPRGEFTMKPNVITEEVLFPVPVLDEPLDEMESEDTEHDGGYVCAECGKRGAASLCWPALFQ
jgi:hypothetical protein